jgi:hypothetical protein
MVGAIDSFSIGMQVMAIGLHTPDRTLTRSHPYSMFGIKQLPWLFRMATTTEASLGLPTWSIIGQLPLRRKAESLSAPGQCTCAHELTSEGAVYNEEAFRYLLQVERNRYEASAHSFALALVHVASRPGQTDRIPATVSSQMFSTLTGTLRDTDVIGWYRDGRIIGIILTHLGDAPISDTTREMSVRLTRALTTDLPNDVARTVKVRLYRPRARVTA